MNLMDVGRKGYCALRITESPHEWTWTHAEQQEMAKAVLDLDAANEMRRGELGAVRQLILHADLILADAGENNSEDTISAAADVTHAAFMEGFGKREAEVIAAAEAYAKAHARYYLASPSWCECDICKVVRRMQERSRT